MARTMFFWKFLISAGLALLTGAWAVYLFEPVNPLSRALLYLIPAGVFGAGWLSDVARKRTTLLPPVVAQIISLQRRSYQDMLRQLSREQRSELGKLFAGRGDRGQFVIMPRGGRARWHAALRFALLNIAIGLGLLFIHAAGVWLFLPDRAQIDQIAQHLQLQLTKDAAGAIHFGGVVNELYAPLNTISKPMQDAVIAREDVRFLTHWGWDWRGKLRAISKSAVYLATFGQVGSKQGGSTLTEQLAKNLFLSADRGLFSGLRRKFKERILAFKLEASYDKGRILEMYLNRVYFGRGAYGVETAARLFFNRAPDQIDQLDAYEAALLAQALTRPSAYNCASKPARAATETRRLLVKMGAPVDEARLQQTLARCVSNGQRDLKIPEPGYLRDWVVPQIKASAYFAHLAGDFTVVTTMNARMQRFAQDAMTTTFARAANAGLFDRGSLPQAALIALTPDGAVRAMMGGREYALAERGLFNRSTLAARQPGSTFKLFVYLTALEQGWTPEQTISDQPDAKGWPKNSHGYSPTPVRLLDAFQNSLNAAAVNLLKKVGVARVQATAQRLGMSGNFPADIGLSLALGTREVNPLEMTAAYAVCANGGLAVKPYGILGVRTKGGTIRYWHEQPRQERLVAESVVTQLNRLLRAVVTDGTGKAAQFGEQIVGGKTGTTQGGADAWFIGCTAYLCAGVWMGYDTPEAMGISGGSLPAQMFREFMQQTHAAAGWSPQPLP